MTEWMLWLAITGGAGQALEVARFESLEACELAERNLVYAISGANDGEMPSKLVHECSEVEKRR